MVYNCYMQNTLLTYNRRWSEAVFKDEHALSAGDFLFMAEELIFGEGSEHLYESIAEIQSEINMFGDSGPGSMLRLRQQIQEYNSIAQRYTQLTGRAAPTLRMPYHNTSHYDPSHD